MDYDYKIIEEKLKQQSPEVQEAFISPEMAETVKSIGDRHGLKLDAEAILFDLTGYILLGLIPSSEFVSKFSKETGVNEKEAGLIAEDVNKEVFGHIRELMQKRQEEEKREVEDADGEDMATLANNAANISHLEQAGGFDVEKTGDEANEQGIAAPTDLENKESILEGIENPAAGNMKISGKTQQMYTEPLIDHLLQTSVSQPQQKSAEVAPVQPTKTLVPPPPANQARSGKDPYKEDVS